MKRLFLYWLVNIGVLQKHQFSGTSIISIINCVIPYLLTPNDYDCFGLTKIFFCSLSAAYAHISYCKKLDFNKLSCYKNWRTPVCNYLHGQLHIAVMFQYMYYCGGNYISFWGQDRLIAWILEFATSPKLYPHNANSASMKIWRNDYDSK